MIFTDLRFLVLFLGCWVMFTALSRRSRPAVLAIWGLLFYAIYAGAALVLVLLLTAGVVVARGRWQAIAAGAAIVALLVWFKLGDASLLPGLTGASAVIVPLGFSYLSFELLHLLIERRRGRIGEITLTKTLAFIFFFPCRIAGPIRRYPEFMAAVDAASPSASDVHDGLLRILLGLAKKFVVADTLALTVAELEFVQTPAHAWVVVLAFSFQLLCDFSAYSDLAIGFSRTLGMRVPENFNYPYLATNIREFWNRWHITLSTWVRDYIFVPTGRRLFATSLRPYPSVIAAVSFLVTFASVGGWHGLTASYLVWGLYHGLLLAMHHAFQAHMPMAIAGSRWYRSSIGSALGVAVTFMCVTIGWLPFMTNLDRARQLFSLMIGVSR